MHILTEQAADNLADQIRKQGDGVRVKRGRTNGRICLHVIAQGSSTTIYHAGEWLIHPSNRDTRTRAKQNIEDVLIQHVATPES